MRVALFASGGDIPLRALRTLARHATVVAVIRRGAPRGLRGALGRLARRLGRSAGPPDELTKAAAELGVPEWHAESPSDPSIPTRLRAAAVDLACIATFPWRLPPDVIDAPGLGTVNLHPSLLPRHRGPNPWFWTYHADDREVGVTLHIAAPRVDSGGILAQRRWELARAHPVAELHREVAERGAALLPDFLGEAERGALRPVPQDEAAATRAPQVVPGSSMLDPRWSAERSWHFLAGLVGQHREPLRCADRVIAYRRVTGYEITDPLAAPGRVEPDTDGEGWRLWCPDGFVRLQGAPS